MQGNCDIPALTGLRGIAALWVFCFHASTTLPHGHWLKVTGAAGFLGVDIFFVLSGYVLALNYASDGRHRSTAAWGDFLWKRLARVYPTHLAALAMFALLALLLGAQFAPPERLSLSGLLRTITLTHAWNLPVLKTWNLVSWSISCEWAAYIAFPLIAAGTLRINSRGLCLALIGLLFAWLYFFIATGHFGYSTIAYGLPRIAAEFTAGVLVFRLRVLDGKAPPWRSVGLVATAGMIFTADALAQQRGQMASMLVMPIFACLVVYGLVRSDGPFERWLARPVWQWAGRISFAFYLVHLMCFSVAEIAVARMGWRGHGVSIVAGFIAALAIAHTLHSFVEQPARAWMLEHLPRARVRAGAASCDSVRHAASRAPEGF